MRHLSTRYSSRNIRLIITLCFAGVVGIIGVLLVYNSRAGTPATSLEPEGGTRSSNAQPVTDSTASASQAVRFSAPPPSNFQSFTGGNSVALIWDMPTYPVKNVEVYRNNVRIAAVTPNTGVLENSMLGKEYDDHSITAGTTYQYKVRAVPTTGAASAFSPVLAVTVPASSAPVPTIITDTAQTPDLTSFVTNYVKPLVATWYPKVANTIAYPNYTPPTIIKIFMDPLTTKNVPGAVCYAASGESPPTIHCDPTWFRDSLAAHDPDLAAVFVHEPTHLIQDGYSNDTTGWATEGLASWASDFYARQHINLYVPRTGDALTSYTPGAFFINYIHKKYDTNFAWRLNVALHSNTYTANLVPSIAQGKTVAQVWAEAKTAYNTGTGPIYGIAHMCLDVQNGTVAYGTKIQLWTCNSTTRQQQWALTYQDPAKKSPTSNGMFEINTPLVPGGGGFCLDVALSGTDSGTKVQYWGCNETDAQMWQHGPNGSLVNVNSGKCLATTGGTSENGNQIIINDCDGSAGERWTTPQ